MTLNILYEDNHVIAVYKPAGFLVQADEGEEKTLMDEVKAYIKERYNKPGDVFLGLVHRLDRNVAGVMVFAKTSKGASRLSEQIRNRTFEKEYHALVQGFPEDESGTLIHYLKKDGKTNKVKAYSEETKDALRAELSYEVVSSNGTYTLLKVKLKTGRPHQIRAQLAKIGHPIVGDVKYGASRSLPDHLICLVATRVNFKLATKDEYKELSVRIPSEWKEYLD